MALPRGMKPTAACFCCVPCCCGMRGGILAFGVLQIFFGSLAFIQGLISAFPWDNLMGHPPLHTIPNLASTTDYAAYVHAANLPLGFLAVSAGVMAVRATCPLRHVLCLHDKILRSSRKLYSLVALQTAIHSMLLFGVTIWLSAAMAENAGWELVTIFWVMSVVLTVAMLYILYVVWSYKAKLERAASGQADAAMQLVKGSAVVTAVAPPVDEEDMEAPLKPGPPSDGLPQAQAHVALGGAGSSNPIIPPQAGYGWGGSTRGKGKASKYGVSPADPEPDSSEGFATLGVP